MGAGATVGLAVLGGYLYRTGRTAGRLDMVLEEFSLGSGSGVDGLGLKFPSVTFKAKLRLKNPTGDDLTISQPYIRVFYNDKKTPIGHSRASAKRHRIKAKSETPLTVDVEFGSNNLFQMPDMLSYLLKRVKGAPSTRRVRMEITIAGNGINQTITKEVNV